MTQAKRDKESIEMKLKDIKMVKLFCVMSCVAVLSGCATIKNEVIKWGIYSVADAVGVIRDSPASETEIDEAE